MRACDGDEVAFSTVTACAGRRPAVNVNAPTGQRRSPEFRGWGQLPLVSTTVPSAQTEQERHGPRTTVVRWVFPRLQETTVTARAIIGRDEQCQVVLLGDEVSRKHAELRKDGPVLAIKDLESRNGVHVNGVKVADAPLAAGDVVRCGDWIGVVTAVDEGAGAARARRFREVAPGLFGSERLAAALEPARRVANDLAVVIQCETWTGKEDAARAVHAWSGRSGKFVSVNCATLSKDLADAELFGHRKGAFTGAETSSEGLFRAAAKGSLFLDEVLEFPVALQPKLLRALSSKRVRPVGEAHELEVDVRVICAAQEPLRVAVEEGRFRPDLQGRLEGLVIALPPLRERREDIAPLFCKFVRDARAATPRIEARLIESLCLHDWPLNVRELQLLARRLVGVHGHEGVLKRSHLPSHMAARGAATPLARAAEVPGAAPKQTRRSTDDETQFAALMDALRREPSMMKAAASIGIRRARAYRLVSARQRETGAESALEPGDDECGRAARASGHARRPRGPRRHDRRQEQPDAAAGQGRHGRRLRGAPRDAVAPARHHVPVAVGGHHRGRHAPVRERSEGRRRPGAPEPGGGHRSGARRTGGALSGHGVSAWGGLRQ